MRSLAVEGIVHTPMYEHNKRKYIKIILPEEQTKFIRNIHENFKIKSKTIAPQDPLHGNLLTVKVPWRYKKVDCVVKGLVPVEAFKQGTTVLANLEYCGGWDIGLFWKITAIESCD